MMEIGMKVPVAANDNHLPYPPPFQDLRTLATHICAGESTIENWVKLGLYAPAAQNRRQATVAVERG